MSLVTRTAVATRTLARPRSGPGLGRLAFREALRDRRLVALAVLTPLVVLLLALAAGQFLAQDRPRTFVVAGGSTSTSVGTHALVESLTDRGDVVSVASGALGAPGPGLDATVVVAPSGDRVTVRVTETGAFAVDGLRREVGDALPGAQVEVLGPDGQDVHGSAGQLLPGAVVLTALVLALPGTAGRVVGWRTRGALDVLLPAVAGRHGPHRAGLRMALLLVPSRWLLTIPSVVVTVVGCAIADVLVVDVTSVAVLASLVLLGSAVCTTLGTLVGCLLRSRREARVLLWPTVVVVAVFGLVLLPSAVLPGAAAAVLRWTPTAVFAEGMRDAVTARTGTATLVSLAVLAVVLVAVTAVLVRAFGRALHPGR